MTKNIILGLALVALCTFAVAMSLSPAMAHPVTMLFTEPHAVATNMAMVMLAPMNSRMRGIVSVRANAAIFAQLQASVEEFKSGHKRELNEMNGHIDQLNAQIAAMKLGGAADGGGNPEMKQASAAVTEFLRSGKPDAMLNLQPRAGMSSDSGPDGGFTVPTQIDRLIQNQLIALSPMRAATGGGVLVSTSDYKKLINRRGATAGWVGERDPRNETETPLLGEIVPPMGEVYAYPSLTQWMIDDSQFNLETFVAENVTDEFNIQEGSAFAFGDGIKKPRGFLTVPMSEASDSARPL
ncbi:phage major capsid protein [Rhizobium lemnae]|uniref:Phage major capsid protein n=1 Tax=Rhizobium lemnae TaxID=1214924 RepID=A0ABV8E2U4_9HYPH|nr:phage major capsid protein [Rhizobium lemnae]MCJ8507173.1 phage major capsid protein [Rhizobium lemnae]